MLLAVYQQYLYDLDWERHKMQKLLKRRDWKCLTCLHALTTHTLLHPYPSFFCTRRTQAQDIDFNFFNFLMLVLFKRTFFDHLLWSIFQPSLHILQITIFHMLDLCGQLSCTASTPVFLTCG